MLRLHRVEPTSEHRGDHPVIRSVEEIDLNPAHVVYFTLISGVPEDLPGCSELDYYRLHLSSGAEIIVAGVGTSADDTLGDHEPNDIPDLLLDALDPDGRRRRALAREHGRIEFLRRAAQEVTKLAGPEAVRVLLAEFGAERIDELLPGQTFNFMARLWALRPDAGQQAGE